MRHIFHTLFSVATQRSLTAIAPAFMAVLLVSSPAHAGFKYTPSVSPQNAFSADADQAPVLTPPPVLLPPSAAPAATRTGMVEGFADKVPLTVALRQILPKGVMFSVSDNVDVLTLVSWHGGRPWQAVLDDTLNAAGLKATYSQNMVLVEKTGGYAPVANNAPITLHEPAAVDYAPTVIGNDAPVAYDDVPPPAPQARSTLGQLVAPPAEPTPTPAGKLTARDLTAMELARIDRTSPAGAGSAPTTTTTSTTAMPTTGMLVAPAGMETSMEPMPLMAGAPEMPPQAAMPNAWEAKSGQTLHEVLADWAQRAGIELNWLSEYDYPIQASMTINGNFETAVRTLLSGFTGASPQPVGRLHHNEQLGQLSLVIEMRGNLYNE